MDRHAKLTVLVNTILDAIPDDADPELSVDALAIVFETMGGQLHTLRCLLEKVTHAAMARKSAKAERLLAAERN